MPTIIRAFPVIVGKDEFLKFIEELAHKRASEVDVFYKRFGVSREVVFWQDTPHGAQIMVFTEVEDLTEVPDVYAKADEPFESWFKQEILRLTGVDLNQMPLGLPSEKVFDWADQSYQPDELGG